MEQKKYATKKLQEKDNFVSNRQDNNLWIKMPSPDTKLSQRENFNKYELVQDEYLKNSWVTENIKQNHGQDRLEKNDNWQFSQLYRETKKDKMKKSKKEIKFLERGMQRVTMRLNRMQQDLLLTPTASMTSIRPKHLTEPEYHNYPENDHYIDQMIC